MTRALAAVLTTLLLGAASAAHAQGGVRTLRCEGDRCDASIAWLVRETAGDSLGCTAFLVASDRAVTARHCVATTRRDGSRDAPSRFELVFAATDVHPDARRGAHVLASAEDADLSFQSSVDWAVLALDAPIDRPPLPVADDGASDGTEVTVFAVEPRGARDAAIVPRRCATTLHSLFAPHVDSRDAPVQVLSGCLLDPGSSGAPLVDGAGRAIGLVHASARRAWPWRERLRFPLELAGAEQSEPAPIAYATALACVALHDRPSPAWCDVRAWRERVRAPGASASRFAHMLLVELAQRSEVLANAMRARLASKDVREGWALAIERDALAVRLVPTARCTTSDAAPDDLDAGIELSIVVGADGVPTVRHALVPGVSVPRCDVTSGTRRARLDARVIAPRSTETGALDVASRESSGVSTDSRAVGRLAEDAEDAPPFGAGRAGRGVRYRTELGAAQNADSSSNRARSSGDGGSVPTRATSQSSRHIDSFVTSP